MKLFSFCCHPGESRDPGFSVRMVLHWIPAFAGMTVLGACSVGPDYVKPAAEIPPAFKEMNGWKQAQPKDNLLRGKWWEIFCDPALNALEAQVDISNQNIKIAEAQFREARALVEEARAGFFPSIGASASETRRSGGRSGIASLTNAGTLSSGTTTTGTTTTTAGPGAVSAVSPVISSGSITNNYSASLNASWELDVWGRVRRAVEANEASAKASAADLQSARLSAQAMLASDYLQLRVNDAQKRLLDKTAADYQKSLQLTQNQYKVGVAARADVVQAQTQLQTTQAQAIDVGVQRAQLEHAIALLVGKPPAAFSIPAVDGVPDVPVIPISVPSILLERRPDIAGAERRAEAANAEIGVAEAAFFPSIGLSASGGFNNDSFAHLFTLPNRFWSIGPSLAETLFDGGLRRAQTEQARATYDQNVASYRQAVLTAFQQVEDNLAALRIYEQEAEIEQAAVASSEESVKLTTNQYKAGLITYLNVVTVQETALANERTALTLRGARLTAAVALIEALGGGWDVSDLNNQAVADDVTESAFWKKFLPWP